ncbi:TPA: hypothetical protein H2R31_002949 [Salmonella enterica]|nr:hypothetical protein [Salmonella enterica]
MEKKTKELVIGDMVKNILNGKYYPLETIERSGAGYIVKLTPASLNGNSYYAEHTTRHLVM